MSYVTVFCRDGACNQPSHTAQNCHNRYVATLPLIARRDWHRLAEALGLRK